MTRDPRPWLLVALLLIPRVAGAADPAGRAMVQDAHRAIAAYHAGQPRSGAVLRVVYFAPKDRDPLPAYAERIDRIMTDVSRYYREELRRLGLETGGLPLEREGGKVVVHTVRGSQPADRYHHESGGLTAAEIREALAGKVDMDREHVVVFYALCRKEPDGRYVFDAPYYGQGSQRNGLCHAADCERLDPLLLKETNQSIVYTEHYYPRVEESVALFNSKYLGGTAHEIGHALGLPHDAGSAAEQRFGVSLMGLGNLSYRKDVWGGGPTAYLARATGLQLASHPLVTGSDRGRWEEPGEAFESLAFEEEAGRIRIEGRVAGAIPAYAVIASLWPSSRPTDHGARTFPLVLKSDDGKFALDLDELRADSYRLKLTSLHVNGATTSQVLPLGFHASGKPDTAALNAAWVVDRAEKAVMRRRPEAREFLSDRAIAAAPSPEARRKLQLLRAVLAPPPPIELARVEGDQVDLSDAAWDEAKVGWGQVARNYFWFDDRNQDGVFLMLGGRFYDKGLYAHSPSRFAFAVNRRWTTFSSTIGLREGAQEQGSAIFTVYGDGRELHRSKVLRAGAQEKVSVDIKEVKVLELRTEGGEGHNHFSWAIWVEPKLRR